MAKTIYIFAGVNGVGKTSFAKLMLPELEGNVSFLNADVIAMQANPRNPEKAAVSAGKEMLARIEKCLSNDESFVLETTLSGLTYAKKIPRWQQAGYTVVMYYLFVDFVEVCLSRIRYRVMQGGHHIPDETVMRRHNRSRVNFDNTYKTLVDKWYLVDANDRPPRIVEKST
ncbi:zeta toxin family protein [Aliiglaciecola sp.]|nr:zeta toxin family protein [Aliiglaciecola sp.]